MSWKSYEELAWTEHIISSQEEYREEASFHLKAAGIQKKHSGTLLHIGCGAGGHDSHYKKYFQVTGVDISGGMLEMARKLNPKAEYVEGDMRRFDLKREFDFVVFAESIMYMLTAEDLKAALQTAEKHLKPDGKMLIVTHLKETFKENNFVYTGEKDGIHVTLFENNYLKSENTYEAVMVYIIRKDEETLIQHDMHEVGLFSEEIWKELFTEAGLEGEAVNMDGFYDEWLMEEGDYPLTLYVLKKT